MNPLGSLLRNTHNLLLFLSYIAITLWFILLVLIIPSFKIMETVYREPHDTRMQTLALRRLEHMKRMGNYSEGFFVWVEGLLEGVGWGFRLWRSESVDGGINRGDEYLR
jgi:hypothetical protein